MSTSAADYYKASYLQNSHEQAKEDLEFAEETRDRIQRRLEECEERVLQTEANVNDAANLVNEAQEQLAAAVASKKQHMAYEEIIDPATGLKQGDKIPIAGEEHMRILFAMNNARQLMEEGQLDDALVAEMVATALLHESEYALNPQALFATGTTLQMKEAEFVDVKSIPENEGIFVNTLVYAKRKCDDGILDESEQSRKELQTLLGGVAVGGRILPEELLDMLGLSNEPDLPDNVRLEILKEIFDQIQAMKKCHGEMTGNRNQNNDGEEDADNNNIDGDDSDEDEEDDRDYFTMNDSCWDAVKTAVANKIALKREANTKELELPSDESANICRYNPKAHYRFASEAANSSVDTLLDSLVQCKLRTRPTNYSKNAPEYERLPFVLRTYDNSGFDLDGDVIAMCGDECFNNMRASKNFVGYQRAPVPVNLEDATTVCALRDSKDTDLPWDRNICKRVFKDGKGKKEWFSSCMADSQNNLIWAADTRSMKIHAFSTKSTDYGNDDSDSEGEGGEKEKKRAAICDAKLSFASPEVKAQSAWVNGSVGLTKCKDTIISSAATGRLSAWKIKSALEDNTKTIDPSIMLVDDNENFLCGDIQYVGGSNLIVAPLRVEFNESKHSSTIRLYDVEVESVAGLFCGTLGEVSVGKQYCVESHSSIFAMSNNVGVVFDTRTYQPTIALHVEKRRSNQILGVPTSSTPVAFTYGSNEEIKCWDLRKPGSHVYTMSTGNTTVNCLLWHEDSSSLLASTESKHIITHGYHAGYMYGNKLSMDEEEELQNEEWPRGAVHGPSYFGSPWNVDCNYSFALLQYSFQNGRKMHERPARLKSET